jgi:hypothetical protein
MGGRAEGLACADPGARTPIGASGNFSLCSSSTVLCECTSECGCGGELIGPVRAINKN